MLANIARVASVFRLEAVAAVAATGRASPRLKLALTLWGAYFTSCIFPALSRYVATVVTVTKMSGRLDRSIPLEAATPLGAFFAAVGAVAVSVHPRTSVAPSASSARTELETRITCDSL